MAVCSGLIRAHIALNIGIHDFFIPHLQHHLAILCLPRLNACSTPDDWMPLFSSSLGIPLADAKANANGYLCWGCSCLSGPVSVAGTLLLLQQVVDCDEIRIRNSTTQTLPVDCNWFLK